MSSTVASREDDGSVSMHSTLSILEGGPVYDISLDTVAETSDEPASLSCFYPKWRGKPVYHGNPEALGWGLDSIGRAVYYIGMAAFLGTALLQLSKEAAGCAPDEVPCNKTFRGMKPSSLLTTYAMVVGVVSASLLPLIGSIVDYTPHRLAVGRWMSVAYCILIVPQIFINSDNWIVIVGLLFGANFVGWAQTLVTYAYLPELTDSEERLTGYTQSFTVLNFGSMVLYLGLIVGVSSLAGFSDDAILTTRFAMIVALVVSSVTLYLSWYKLLKKRPPARELPEGRSIWTAGFVQIWHTSKKIYRDFPALKWFYFSISMVDAAINSLGTILLTYLTDTLQFGSRENGITILLMLVGSIPGALAAGPIIRWLNPIRSALVGTAILMVNTIILSLVLKEPSQKIEAYAFAFVWGAGTGLKWTTDRLLASTLIPEGQDTELMGFFLFSGQVFVWLPPLIFTVLNEAGVNQSIGIGVQSVFFLIGIIALLCMGNYRDAVEHAGRYAGDATKENNGAEDDDLQLEIGDDDDEEALAAACEVKPRKNTEETVAESVADQI